MEEPKIVYICNHYINKTEEKTKTEERVKSSNNIDIICEEGIVKKVLSVYKLNDDDTFNIYYLDTDFKLIDDYKIEWISDNKPEHLDKFFVEYLNIIRTSKQYTSEDCVKCSGFGWYVGLFENNNTVVNKIEGFNKLVQEFVKILLTYKNGNYGSTISELIGSELNNEDALSTEVASRVYECADQYKNIQANEIANKVNIPNSERLRSVFVTDVDVNVDEGGVFMSIVLTSEAGDSSQLNLLV